MLHVSTDESFSFFIYAFCFVWLLCFFFFFVVSEKFTNYRTIAYSSGSAHANRVRQIRLDLCNGKGRNSWVCCVGRRPTNEESEIRKSKKKQISAVPNGSKKYSWKKQPAFYGYKICTDVCVKFASRSLSHSSYNLSVQLVNLLIWFA